MLKIAAYVLLVAPLSGFMVGVLTILLVSAMEGELSDWDYSLFLIQDFAIPFGAPVGFLFGLVTAPLVRRVSWPRIFFASAMGVVAGGVGGTIGSLYGAAFFTAVGFFAALLAIPPKDSPGDTSE